MENVQEFEVRMMERALRRRRLLTTVATTPPPTPPPSPPPQIPIPQEVSPQQQKRRTRLALLAGRINEYLKEEDVSIAQDGKSVESISNPMTTKNTKRVIKETNDLAKKKFMKTNANESTLKEPLPDNGPVVPSLSDKSLLGLKVSVAQRRALFEPNIAAPKPNKTTTIVTLSLTKTTTTANDSTPTTSEEKSDIPILDKLSTPPRPIPCSASTPPSRRGTRPRISPALAAIAASSSSDLVAQKHQAWTPPCIKNVILKKKLIDDLEDDQMPNDNDIISKEAATSSPITNAIADSPADRIAKSVEPFSVPASPSSSKLYPDLSYVEEKDANDTINQITGCKRRSNGSSTLNASTKSSESPSKNDIDNIEIIAKRHRSQLINPLSDNLADVLAEKSPKLASTSFNTQSCDTSSSMLSSTYSPMTQASTSFLYYGANRNHLGKHAMSTEERGLNMALNYEPDYLEPRNLNNEVDDMMIVNEVVCNDLRSDNKKSSNDNNFESLMELDDEQSQDRICNNDGDKPALVHTISTYRKQQQQLRISGTPCKVGRKELNEKEGNALSTLFQKPLQQLNEDDEDDEDYKLQELELVAERARDLERTVVPEQDRIIEQATQALNICDLYRQKSGIKQIMSNNFLPEHVHAERLLLIAGLKRTDAVREAQRLRVEHTLLPGGITGRRFNPLNVGSKGKTLVIESLRVPILSALISGGSNNKTKYTPNEGTENLTRWPGGYRYFVCAVRAAATTHRPPMTAATRPADSVEESMSRFALDSARRGDDGIGYGYVEFITKKQLKSSSSRKCPMPTESEGAPIMIKGLDDGGWKITVELYGLSPSATGEYDHHINSNNKEHDKHENRSVLDKLWSTVTTPSKESKKHYTTTTSCIESPGGPMAVRNTVFRQLGYFVFSDGQVDRQQFTLNKVHQSSSSASTSRGSTITQTEETVRIHMHLLEDGEQYVYEDEEGEINFETLSLGSKQYVGNGSLVVAAKKPLKLPSCQRTEGFLTLFDDHELRANVIIGQQWQRRWNIGSGSSGGTTSWRRLWFRVEVINNTEQEVSITNDDLSLKQQDPNDNNTCQNTIILRYWMYPEHVEQERMPLGSIDLSRCLPEPSLKTKTRSISQQQPTPAEPAPADLCARPNSLKLQFCRITNDDNLDSDDDYLLLAADTADERRQWCDTVNAAVHAIGEYQDRIRVAEEAQLKQKEQIQQKRRLQEQHCTGAWPTTPSGSGKSFSKKKKFYK